MPPIRKIGTLFYDLEARTNQFEKSMASSGLSAKRLGGIIKAHPVAAAAALVAAFALVAAKATKMAVALEQSFGEISTLVDTTKVDVGELKDEMLALFQSMPVDQLQDMSRGLYQIISASIPAAQSIDFLRIATEAAVAGLTSVEVAVDGLTTVVNAWKESNITAAEVADQMFTAVRFGKTTFDEVAVSVGRVAGLAATMGIAFKDVLANATALTLGGVDMELAMRSIRQVLANVLRPTTALVTKFPEIAKVFNRAKLEADGLTKFMVDLAEALKGNKDAAVLMFQDVNALNAALQLTGRDGKRVTRLLKEMENSAGAATEAFGKMEGTTANLAKTFKNQLSVQLIKLGESILPTVNAHLRVLVGIMARLNGEIERMRFDRISSELKVMLDNLDTVSGKNLDLDNLSPGQKVGAGASLEDLFKAAGEAAGDTTGQIRTLQGAIEALDRAGTKGRDLGHFLTVDTRDIIGPIGEALGIFDKLEQKNSTFSKEFILNQEGVSRLSNAPLDRLLLLDRFFNDISISGLVAEDQIAGVARALKILNDLIGDRRPDAPIPVFDRFIPIEGTPRGSIRDIHQRLLPGSGEIINLGDADVTEFQRQTRFDKLGTFLNLEEELDLAPVLNRIKASVAKELGDVQGLRDVLFAALEVEINAALADVAKRFPDEVDKDARAEAIQRVQDGYKEVGKAIEQGLKNLDAANLDKLTADVNKRIAENLGDVDGIRKVLRDELARELKEKLTKAVTPEHAAIEAQYKRLEDDMERGFRQIDIDKLEELAAEVNQRVAESLGSFEGLREAARAGLERELEAALKAAPEKSRAAIQAFFDELFEVQDVQNERSAFDRVIDLQKKAAALTKTLVDDMKVSLEELTESYRRAYDDKIPEYIQTYLDSLEQLIPTKHAVERIGQGFEDLQPQIDEALVLLEDFNFAGPAIGLLGMLEAWGFELRGRITEARELKLPFDDLLKLYKAIVAQAGLIVSGIANAGDGHDETADALLKQRRLMQAAARQIESMVRGALQLADAFGLISREVADIVGGLTQAIANMPDLIASVEAFNKAKNQANLLAAAGAALPVLGGIAAVATAIPGLFAGGQSPEEKARLEALKRNNDAIEKLTREIGNLATNVTGFDFQEALDAIALVLDPSLTAPGQTFFDETGLEAFLKRQGFSYQELIAIAADFDITLDGTIASWEAFLEALRNEELATIRDTVAGRMRALRLEFELFDIEDPLEQLKKMSEIFQEAGANLPDAEDFDLTTAEGRAAFEAELQRMFELARTEGGLTAEDLGGLTLDQYLDALAEMERLLDRQEATEGSGGFNVSRTITEVTGNRMVGELTTANVHLAEIAASTLVLATATLMANVGVQRAPGPLINIEQLVITADPLNPESTGAIQARAFMEEVDRQQGDRLRQRQLGSGTVIRE